jgi:hypothetical protein
MPYIILRDRWIDIIILNVLAPNKNKCDLTVLWGTRASILFISEVSHEHFVRRSQCNSGEEEIISNDNWLQVAKTYNLNGIRIVSFATQTTLVVKSTMFHQFKIHNTWTSDGQAYVQNDHASTDRRRQSSALTVRSFTRASWDNDRYLVVATLMERLHR